MSKKAVWLSDIEFIEMHSSDWERLESEAFEPDESVQAQLNENQQVVLDWLKESCKLYGLREVIEIIGFLPTTGGKMKYKQIAYAYADLNEVELAQAIQVFSQWALEQEEE
ncbi:hypothetical protein ACT0K6_001282 [Enterococcus faecalis]|uniref:hypothetical protein n=1 Tax=Enterococcus faecalis TaxID=1351 RepID=UPI001921E49D|nr:hypothetical protein [Enterococcus faecalis]EGO6689272.1 hypothetical protein [Enterococcus faecalis]EGO8519056.1 hypothetical protein [Enterococcus faecalis]EID1478411.1 hypothetical protein [Enterococcus faecalis]EJJ0974346.1 hypothetical protein [Enterococcus faecalis]